MKTFYRIGVLIVVITGVCITDAEATKWPIIQPLHVDRTFIIDDKSIDTLLVVSIKDVNGTLVYKLECHNGSYDDASEINFSGDFQCALFALRRGERTSGNLLRTDEEVERRSDSFNRGRMIYSELQGRCAANPEYGPVRRFRVRGMFLTMRFTNLQWSRNIGSQRSPLVGFTVDISVVADETAKSATAERVKTPRPPAECM